MGICLFCDKQELSKQTLTSTGLGENLSGREGWTTLFASGLLKTRTAGRIQPTRRRRQDVGLSVSALSFTTPSTLTIRRVCLRLVQPTVYRYRQGLLGCQCQNSGDPQRTAGHAPRRATLARRSMWTTPSGVPAGRVCRKHSAG